MFTELSFNLVGHLLYKFGCHKVGHKMVAMSLAGDFGLCKAQRKWLIDHCPHSFNCSSCSNWTCSGGQRLDWANWANTV